MKFLKIILIFTIFVEIVVSQKFTESDTNIKNIQESESKIKLSGIIENKKLGQTNNEATKRFETQPSNLKLTNEAYKFNNYMTQSYHNQYPQNNRWHYIEHRTWHSSRNKDGKWEQKDQRKFQQFGTPPSSFQTFKHEDIKPTSFQIPNYQNFFYPAQGQITDFIPHGGFNYYNGVYPYFAHTQG